VVGHPSFIFNTMKKIDISTPKYPNKFTIVDDEDFEKLNQYKWYYDNQGYAHRRFYYKDKKSRIIGMHRVIMGDPKGKLIDHINMDGLDNRKSNLRICGKRENSINIGLRKNNKSGYKGVHRNTKSNVPWRVNLKDNGKQVCVGYFYDVKEAAKAYNKKALELYGEYARLNIIKD
jgi:hypothetical protein